MCTKRYTSGVNTRIVYTLALCIGICLGIGGAFAFTTYAFVLPKTYTVRGIVVSKPTEPLAISIHHPPVLATSTPRPVHINKRTAFFRSTSLYAEYGIITRMTAATTSQPTTILPGTPLLIAETSADSPALTVVVFERVQE